MDPHGSTGERRRGGDAVEDGRDPLIGQTLSHYRIVEQDGRQAAWASLYKAEDTRLRPPCGSQVRLRRTLARPRGLGPVRARGANGIGTEPPEHLHHPRHRRAGRAVVHRHGVSGGHDAEGSARRRCAEHELSPQRGNASRHRAGRRAQLQASSTAISNPKTSSSGRATT